MFETLTDLQLALLTRALVTEKNIIQRTVSDNYTNQRMAIGEMIMAANAESERRIQKSNPDIKNCVQCNNQFFVPQHHDPTYASFHEFVEG